MLICARLSIWEDADGIRLADHVVGRAIFRRHVDHAERSAVAPAAEFERAAHGRQHAECQHVDLQQAEFLEIVLVPPG